MLLWGSQRCPRPALLLCPSLLFSPQGIVSLFFLRAEKAFTSPCSSSESFHERYFFFFSSFFSTKLIFHLLLREMSCHFFFLQKKKKDFPPAFTNKTTHPCFFTLSKTWCRAVLKLIPGLALQVGSVGQGHRQPSLVLCRATIHSSPSQGLTLYVFKTLAL